MTRISKRLAYPVLSLVVLLGAWLWLAPRSEPRASAGAGHAPLEGRGAAHPGGSPVPRAARLPIARKPSQGQPAVGRAPATAPSPEQVLEQELTADLPPWEGKQMSEYTAEEREATGLTNEKLFASAGSVHWAVLASELREHLAADLHAAMSGLSDSYMEAALPYTHDATDEHLEQERSLLPRVRDAIATKTISRDAQRSLEFLEVHVQMWDNGEAEKLVDRKIERENDGMKRMALRARKHEDPEAAASEGTERGD